jgi:hypothetical protein
MTTIAGRVAQLLRLALVTDKTGEALGAIEGLKRTLHAAGLDAHDLVVGLNDVRSQVASFGAGDWRQMVNACQRRGDCLSDREQRFLNTLSNYQTRPSEKQIVWLADIFARLRGAA